MSAEHSHISSGSQLREAIERLESRQQEEGRVLHEHFLRTYESMRPVNLIRSALHEVTESEELKEHLVSSGVGLVAGHVSKKVYDGVNGNTSGSLTGTAIQFGVTNLVARNPEVVMAAGRGLFTWAYAAWKNREREEEHYQDV
jgi:hypothetical protein